MLWATMYGSPVAIATVAFLFPGTTTHSKRAAVWSLVCFHDVAQPLSPIEACQDNLHDKILRRRLPYTC